MKTQLFLFLFFTVSVFCNSQEIKVNTLPNSGSLIAHWKLDETSGLTTQDELGNSHGTLLDMDGSEWEKGFDGNAVNFTNTAVSSRISVPDNTTLNFSNDQSFTLSALVKADPITNTFEMNIAGKGATTVVPENNWEGKWYRMSLKFQKINFFVDDNINKTQLSVDISGIYPVNEWAHIAGVRDRGADSLRLYLNGVKIGAMKDITEGDISTDSLPFLIGNYELLEQNFIGFLDDLLVYNYALNDDEVLALYQGYFGAGRPAADFSVTYLSENRSVEFTDNSSGDINNWLWDFGDGTGSTEQNPIHVYDNVGPFAVSLTVTGPGGTDTETKANFVNFHESQTFTVYLHPDDTFKDYPYLEEWNQDIYVNNYTLEWKYPLTSETLGNSFILNLIGGSQGIYGTSLVAEILLKDNIGETSIATKTFSAPCIYTLPYYTIYPKKMYTEISGVVPSVHPGDVLLLRLKVETGAAGRIMYGTNVGLNYLTVLGPLMSPYLSSPINEIDNVSVNPVLAWMETDGATSYFLQVSAQSDFSTIVFSDSNVVATSQQVYNLENFTAYYWRVKAKNFTGFSDWSEVWKFTTLKGIPEIPVLSSPADGSSNQPLSLTLAWNSSDRAEDYSLQVSTVSNFSSTIVDESEIASTTKEIGGLSDNTTYYWRVNAANEGGSTGWSEIWNFTTTDHVGFNDVHVNETFRFYPNPCENVLCIEGIEHDYAMVSVLSMDGRVWVQICGTGINQIDLNYLPKGSCLLKISNSRFAWVNKIIIQ